jgi:hypothetical protein
MKTVPYKKIRDGVISRMGIDPAQPILPSQASALAEYLTTAAATAWLFFEWPDTTFIESRTVIDENTDPHIPLIQIGQTPIGHVLAVYDQKPSDYSLARELEFTVTTDRLDILDEDYVPGPVHVKFYLPQPRFTSDDYNPSTTYAPGDIVYHPATGDCYEAIAESTGNLPTNEEFWLRHRIPAFLADYLKFYALAETLAEDGQYDKSSYQFARAEGILQQRMDDAWLRQGEIRRYSAMLYST